jgi:hypothetical protein
LNSTIHAKITKQNHFVFMAVRLWAHIGCLSTDVNWNDSDVEFVCKRCREDPLVDIYLPSIYTRMHADRQTC